MEPKIEDFILKINSLGSGLCPVDCDLCIELPPYFRDEEWANKRGIIQEEILKLKNSCEKHKKKLKIEFSNCKWIDPLPLMFLLLEIFSAREHNIRVEINTPEPDENLKQQLEVGQPYKGSPNPLLRFLHEGGFFDCLELLQNDEDLVYLQAEDREEKYRSLLAIPSYENALFTPITLCENIPTTTDDPSFAKKKVKELIRGVKTKLNSKLRPHVNEQITYKLRTILQKIIQNAQEHAYENGESPRHLVIYVRFRSGGQNDLSIKDKDIFTTNRKIFN